MAVGDVYEVVYRGDFFGEAVYNVLHFQTLVAVPLFLLLPQAVADVLWESGVSDGVHAITTEDYVVPEASIQMISPSLGAQIVVPLTGIAGGQSGGAMNNVACVVTWRTATGGRSARGRNYFGPVAEAVYLNGLVNDAQADALQVGVDAFIDIYGSDGSDTDWRFVVWSPLQTVARVVTAGIVRPRGRSQRRRNIGIGI